MAELITLPVGLENYATAKFDKLVAEGEILYEEAQWKRVEDKRFTMNFLISPALLKKPILSKNDSGRTQSQGPFLNPDPNFVLGSVGPDHTLIFNKFCVSRPMFLLHTKTFQPQTDGLNKSDFAAIWSLLIYFKFPQMVLYNCGADAGASQGHKHLQMFPAPTSENCVMFPENLDLYYDRVQSDHAIPFHNFVIGLEKQITITKLVSKYELLLSATKSALAVAGHTGTDYNLVLVPGWMAMIPRTHANYEGKAPTNGAGMMGMAWVKNEAEVALWLGFGVVQHLTHLGLRQ